MDWANYTKRGQKLDFCLMLRSWRRRLRPWLHLKKKISFKDVWHSLLITYANDFLHDEQSIILYNYYQSANPPFLRWNFDPFCLDVYDSCECEAPFRVAKDYSKHCRFWRVSHAHREQLSRKEYEDRGIPTWGAMIGTVWAYALHKRWWFEKLNSNVLI